MHTDVPEPFPQAYDLMVPAFFFVSVFFISTKYDFKTFLKKKFTSLIIPFIFWYAISYLLFCLLKLCFLNIESLTVAKGLLDCFTSKIWFNGPLCFLPSLFVCSLLIYLSNRYILKEYCRSLSTLAVGILGYICGYNNFILPFSIDSGLAAMPFIYFGSLLKRYSLIEKIKILPMVLIGGFVIFSLLVDTPIDLGNNIFKINYFLHVSIY